MPAASRCWATRERSPRCVRVSKRRSSKFAPARCDSTSASACITGSTPTFPSCCWPRTRMLKLALERDLKEDVGWAHYLRGCARYQTNDLKGAEADFSEVMSQRYVAHGFPFSQSAFGLASVLLARGAFDEALRDRGFGERVCGGDEQHPHRPRRRGIPCVHRLAEGSPRRSQVPGSLLPIPTAAPVPLNTFLVTRVLRAKVLLALGTAASLTEAHDALAHLHELARTTHNTRFLIETLALEALLHEARADREASLAALAQALVLAEPGGMIRVFVDLGPGMAQLLAELAKRIGRVGLSPSPSCSFRGERAGRAGTKLAGTEACGSEFDGCTERG